MAEGYNETQESNRDGPLSVYNIEELTDWEKDRHPIKKSLTACYNGMHLDGLTLHHNIEPFSKTEEEEDDDLDRKNKIVFCARHNRLDFIPDVIYKYSNILLLDLSDNHLTEISESIFELKKLNVFIARNNFLSDYSLPKKLCSLENLEILNLSGNLFRTIPPEIVDIKQLRSLHMGENQLEEIPRDIWRLEKLELLYLGGNNLKDIPAEMGRLLHLRSLALCENQLQSLPSTISCLRRLRSLALYRNQLTTLPPEIVTLKGLIELSLRDNPLVVRFIQDMTYDPPSLQELAARSVKLFKVPYKERDLPASLISYLKTACRCVNPKCKGVYFDVRVEHIKFVDFCGKYRIPLLQYLCSPRCSTSPIVSSNSDTNSSDDETDVPESRLRRVLLG